ncbi:MAG: 4'-phosphopantetheinyl transferase superfamily protein [Legionellaceae bacterium]|nr:4'-phosphopantetheinyl transferase superfamily protein [Legionellaceae bacterium]
MKPIQYTSSASEPCDLKSTRVDIWSFALDAPLPEPGFTLLNAEEQARAKRFHFAHHQHHFTRARMMLRLILARYLAPSHTAETLVFDYAEHGKPFLPKHPELQFNLSHSGNQGLLAVGKTHPLGIDIEQYADRPYEGIGSHVFSDEENAILRAMPKSLKPMVFFNFWAQKEALIKMLGLGLSYPTTRLTVPTYPSTHQTILDPVYHSTSKLLAFMPRVAYCAALCHHLDIQEITYTALRI